MQIEIEGQTYRTVAKIDAIAQFHVLRRILPVLGSVFDGDETGLMVRGVAALAKMPDADCNFVLHTCLSIVQRQQANAWAPVLAPQQVLKPMFEDLSLMAMMKLTGEVIKENLSGFFAEAAALGLEFPAMAATG